MCNQSIIVKNRNVEVLYFKLSMEFRKLDDSIITSTSSMPCFRFLQNYAQNSFKTIAGKKI